MNEQKRKREEIRMPGEGTGVYGQDPLVYLKPGDKPELDGFLEELKRLDEEREARNDNSDRKNDETPPKKGRDFTAPVAKSLKGGKRAKGEESARIGKGGDKRQVNPRWLTFAVVAIVGPVVTLLLVLVLMRLPAAPDGATKEKGEGARPSAAPGESPVPSGMATPHIAVTPSTTAAPQKTAESKPSSSSSEGSKSPSPVTSPLSPRVKAPAATQEDPYAPSPARTPAPPSASPSALPPVATEDKPEKQVPKGPGFEKPKAEF